MSIINEEENMLINIQHNIKETRILKKKIYYSLQYQLASILIPNPPFFKFTKIKQLIEKYRLLIKRKIC